MLAEPQLASPASNAGAQSGLGAAPQALEMATARGLCWHPDRWQPPTCPLQCADAACIPRTRSPRRPARRCPCHRRRRRRLRGAHRGAPPRRRRPVRRRRHQICRQALRRPHRPTTLRLYRSRRRRHRHRRSTTTQHTSLGTRHRRRRRAHRRSHRAASQAAAAASATVAAVAAAVGVSSRWPSASAVRCWR